MKNEFNTKNIKVINYNDLELLALNLSSEKYIITLTNIDKLELNIDFSISKIVKLKINNIDFAKMNIYINNKKELYVFFDLFLNNFLTFNIKNIELNIILLFFNNTNVLNKILNNIIEVYKEFLFKKNYTNNKEQTQYYLDYKKYLQEYYYSLLKDLIIEAKNINDLYIN